VGNVREIMNVQFSWYPASQIAAVTSLADLLFVFRDPELIDVYNKESDGLEERFTLQGVADMSDMTSCAHKMCVCILLPVARSASIDLH